MKRGEVTGRKEKRSQLVVKINKLFIKKDAVRGEEGATEVRENQVQPLVPTRQRKQPVLGRR